MTIEIPLTKGYVALIDDEDYPLVKGYTWCAVEKGNTAYAKTNIYLGNGKSKGLYMHRLILGAKAGEHVDHVNGKGFVNTRINLRICTPAENLMNAGKQKNNSSGYKGVSKDEKRGVWKSCISVKGKTVHLGTFETPEKAHEKYCEAAAYYQGEFAHKTVKDKISKIPEKEPHKRRCAFKRSNNTSGKIGVQWHKAQGKWAAVISVKGVNKSLGYFVKLEDAIAARIKAEKELVPDKEWLG